VPNELSFHFKPGSVGVSWGLALSAIMHQCVTDRTLALQYLMMV
jgi:hypothetical protein